MTKTICDISGTAPAFSYTFGKTAGLPSIVLDLCDDCAADIEDYIRKQRKLKDVEAVMDTVEVKDVQ